jgi:hypothetical protein
MTPLLLLKYGLVIAFVALLFFAGIVALVEYTTKR